MTMFLGTPDQRSSGRKSNTRQSVARFDAERQALAVMDHPGPAGVGTTPEERTGCARLRHDAEGMADVRLKGPRVASLRVAPLNLQLLVKGARRLDGGSGKLSMPAGKHPAGGVPTLVVRE
jgi:hypothetical protein